MKRQIKRRRYGKAKQKKLQHTIKFDVPIKVHAKELESLASRLQQINEGEKSELARELHDELGAILTASRMDIAWVRQHLTIEQSVLAGKLSRALQHLDQGIHLKRRIIENLRPTTLTTLGFTVAARDLAEQMSSQSGWQLELQFPESDPGFPQDVAIALFRILQESLVNAAKHARASAVRVSMVCGDEVIKLEVEDNGVGFLNGKMNAKISGLLDMRQRAASYGGLFEIKSRPDQGTLVSASLYLKGRKSPSL